MTAGLCECGCGERTRLATSTHVRFGYAIGEPLRFVNGHNANAKRLEVEYLTDDATGCWTWQGHTSRDGYARFGRAWRRRNPGRSVYAHRAYFEDHVGPIPEGFDVDHLCFNRACVNPAHLEAVTRAENNRRKVARYYARKAAA